MSMLILGANSDVAYAVAKRFAQDGLDKMWLASRDLELLSKKARDLQVRYDVQTETLFFDATDFSSHKSLYEKLIPSPHIVLIAFGYLGNQKSAQSNFDEARHIMDANFTGAASMLEIVAADFERRCRGTIIAISSVAGERGRQSNYVYGSAKGALSIYLSGLRMRLAKSKVHVITVLPGFINSKMTRDMVLPGILTSNPAEVAEDIHKAYKRSKSVIYTKWFWKWIMAVIKSIPENVFRRLNM